MIQTAKCKLCRREGQKLMLKGDRCFTAKCAIVKRNYAPGMKGAAGGGFKKSTEYGKQLREKQKAKRIYGISENKFRKYYDEAIKSKTASAEILIHSLEMRLDNVIYRAGLAKSRNQAKQLVAHGFFFVNKYKTDISSYQVKMNDIIKVTETKTDKTYLKGVKEDLKKNKDVIIPSWMTFDKEKMEIKILSTPTIKEIEQGFDIKMIIEFYSR